MRRVVPSHSKIGNFVKQIYGGGRGLKKSPIHQTIISLGRLAGCNFDTKLCSISRHGAISTEYWRYKNKESLNGVRGVNLTR